MESIRFSEAELGMMKQVISLLEAATTVAERRPLLSKLTSFTSSMISLRKPTTKRPSICLHQIQKLHFLDTQDTIYTFFYEEKHHVQNAGKAPL